MPIHGPARSASGHVITVADAAGGQEHGVRFSIGYTTDPRTTLIVVR